MTEPPSHSSQEGAPSEDDAGGRGEAGVQGGASARPISSTVWALGWVSLVTDVATEMVAPLLPGFVDKTLGAGKIGVGLIEGLADSFSALLRLPSGAISDRMPRRKPLILLGYGLSGLVRPLIGLAAVAWHALPIRLLDRVGKGLRSAPRDALIAESTAPEHRGRAFGVHRAMDHAGAAIGPLLSWGILTLWPGQERTMFLATIGPGVVVILVLLLAVRERARFAPGEEPAPLGDTAAAPESSQVPKQPPARDWSLAGFDPRFRWFLAAIVLFMLGNSTDFFLLLRASELGLAQTTLLPLWCVFHVAKSLANARLGKLSDRRDARVWLLVGWGIYALVYAGFAAATQVWHAWALFLVYALYYGLAEPAEKALVARYSPVERRGTGFGWYNLAVGAAALPASLIFGAIWQYSSWGAAGAFGLGAAMAAGAALVLAGTFHVKHSGT